MNVRLLGRLLIAGAVLAALAGCQPPRFKGYESFSSAVTPNPPPTYKVDPYGFSTIADGSGGRDPRASYGSGANSAFDGVPEIYNAADAGHYAKMAKHSDAKEYLVPDPKTQDKMVRFLGSDYYPAGEHEVTSANTESGPPE